jgi:hypothetical protein
MRESDHVYFHRRAEQEREAAVRCTNDSVAQVHLELAQLYEDRASRPTLRIVSPAVQVQQQVRAIA